MDYVRGVPNPGVLERYLAPEDPRERRPRLERIESSVQDGFRLLRRRVKKLDRQQHGPARTSAL